MAELWINNLIVVSVGPRGLWALVPCTACTCDTPLYIAIDYTLYTKHHTPLI